jgi:predicted neutral ceramidase superfamily lipid hydrolase
MNDFGLYFELGYKHIADFNGIDHILFVAALCLRFQFADWRKILILITAFTIGHSITLALSVFSVVHYSVKWIEFLIPVTIVITAISNVFVKKFVFKTKFPVIYFFALVFRAGAWTGLQQLPEKPAGPRPERGSATAGL